MELAACSAAISLALLVACPFAFAGSPDGVSIKVFTSQDDQFWTNSVIMKKRFRSADLFLAIERGAMANVKP